ncbi:MAG TPA: hypothetical protein VLC92_00360 [Rhodocyclaceae bacterium]|nr:hypothetical protein [Rhodocyclaceae bacterium]
MLDVARERGFPIEHLPALTPEFIAENRELELTLERALSQAWNRCNPGRIQTRAEVEAEARATALAKLHPWEARGDLKLFFVELGDRYMKTERSAIRRFTYGAFKGRDGDTMPSWMVPPHSGHKGKPVKLADSTRETQPDFEHPVGNLNAKQTFGGLSRIGQRSVLDWVDRAYGRRPSWATLRTSETQRGKRGPDKQPRKRRGCH